MVQGEASEQALVAIAKLAAARDAAEAVLMGRWMASPDTIAAIAALVASSAQHARWAETERAA